MACSSCASFLSLRLCSGFIHLLKSVSLVSYSTNTKARTENVALGLSLQLCSGFIHLLKSVSLVLYSTNTKARTENVALGLSHQLRSGFAHLLKCPWFRTPQTQRHVQNMLRLDYRSNCALNLLNCLHVLGFVIHKHKGTYDKQGTQTEPHIVNRVCTVTTHEPRHI